MLRKVCPEVPAERAETETLQESDQETYLLGLHQDDWFHRQNQTEATGTVWSSDQWMKITLGDFGDLENR